MDQRIKDITKLCTLAHKDQEGIKRGLDLLEYDFVDFFSTKDDMQGFVGKKDNKQILIFRESEKTVKDWLNNANIFEMEDFGKIYHGGYLKLILNNFDTVCNYLDDLDIVIGGFSQGGGLAEVLANYLNDNTGFNPWFANLDGPAVIKNKGYKNGVRTINSNDPVPLSTLLFGYKHWVDLIYFTFRGNCYINPKKILRRIDYLMETGEDIIELSLGKIDMEHSISEINKNWLKNIKKIEKKL